MISKTRAYVMGAVASVSCLTLLGLVSLVAVKDYIEQEKPSCTMLKENLTVVAFGNKKHPMTKELCDKWKGEFYEGLSQDKDG